MKYLIIILLLTSCGQVFHMKRFIKKGGTIEPIERTITLTDTLQGADGKDSIVFRDLIVPCPEPIVNTRWKTRIELRFDSKRFKDSLRHYRILDKQKQKYTLRTHRTDARVEKNENNNETKQIKAKWNLWIVLISLVLGWLVPKLAQKLWRKYK